MNPAANERIRAFTVPQRKIEHPFVTQCKKIWSVVKWVFVKIGEFFKNLFHIGQLNLSQRDIDLIQTAAQRRPTPPPSPRIAPLRERSVSQVQLEGPQEGPEEAEEEVPEIQDAVMREFHHTTQQVVEDMMNAIFEEKIQAAVTNVQGGLAQVSNVLKIAADFGIRIGDKAAKPIFEMVKSVSLEEKLKPDFLNLIEWLLVDGKMADFRRELRRALENDIEKEAIDQFIDPCVEWLFRSDHQESLGTFYARREITPQYYKERIENVFEKALSILFNYRIESFINNCQEKLDGRLPDIIRQGILRNGKKMSDILVRRLIVLVETSDYPKLFDGLIHATLNHTDAVIRVEDAKKRIVEQGKKKIVQAQKAVKARPKPGSKAEENKNELIQFLQELQLKGIEELIQNHEKYPNAEQLTENEVFNIGCEVWLEELAKRATVETFTGFRVGQERICEPAIANLMEHPEITPEQKGKIEEEMFDHLAEELIGLLFPEQEVEYPDGTKETVDGLVFLISQVEIPAEFRDIAAEGVRIYEQILSQESQEAIGNAYNKVWAAVGKWLQEMIVSETKKIIHKGLVKAAKLLLEQLVTPNLINDLMARTLLPAIQKQILAGFAILAIKNDIPKYAGLFHELIACEGDEEQRKDKLHHIQQELFNKVHESCKEYREDFLQYNYQDFVEIVNPGIDAINAGILQYRNKHGVQTEESAVTAIQAYFAKVPTETRDELGELFVNLAFGIGGLKGAANFFSPLYKGRISKELSQAVHQLRKSPHQLFHLLTEQIRQAHLDKAFFKANLFAERAVPNEGETNRLLDQEFTKTAKAAYDICRESAGSFLAKWSIGPDHRAIDGVIRNIYKKVFGNQLMVHNLLLRVQSVITGALSDASRQVNGFVGGGPIQVTQAPTLLPSLF